LLLDNATWERLATVKANSPRAVRSLDFSPDGRLLAVANIDQQVNIWDLRLVRRGLTRLRLDWPDSASSSDDSPGSSTADATAPPVVEIRLEP
jgi:WD40 repeat protein